MMGYYDVVLGLIPVTLLGISGALYAVGIGLSIAVPIAALVAAGLICHGLFIRAPVESPVGATVDSATPPSTHQFAD